MNNRINKFMLFYFFSFCDIFVARVSFGRVKMRDGATFKQTSSNQERAKLNQNQTFLGHTTREELSRCMRV